MTFMHIDVQIVRAQIEDASKLSLIHQSGIETGNATFETTPRSAKLFAEQICAEKGVFLVARTHQRVVGFANVVPIEDHCTQAGIGEYGIYLDKSARGHGVGKQLLTALIKHAQERCYYKLIGRIFDDNNASLHLANQLKFRTVGTLYRHGKIADQWKHVVLVEKLLDELPDEL